MIPDKWLWRLYWLGFVVALAVTIWAFIQTGAR